MKLTMAERKLMTERLKQLRTYAVRCLKNKKMDEYLNTLNSRELKLLEDTLIVQNPYFLCSSQVLHESHD
ncbi:Uncharacterised protein [Candidatus Tiddalikarchaeum anstoanum]|nr:Uncharacterised protein [Candidatus Tiddalikarchaeum anstoanum]